jgi:hypothetical protein
MTNKEKRVLFCFAVFAVVPPPLYFLLSHFGGASAAGVTGAIGGMCTFASFLFAKRRWPDSTVKLK